MNRQSNKITAIYIRIDGGKTAAKDTITHQQEMLTHYAQEHGLDNIRVFSDQGYNGLSDNRPALQELMTAITGGEVATLVVHGIDRLYRDYAKCAHFIDEILAQHHVALYAVKDAITPETPFVPLFPAVPSMKGGVR